MVDLSGNCHVCGKAIPLSDFEKRRAVVLLKRRYCRECSDAVTGVASASRAPFATLRRVTHLAGLFSPGWRKL